MNQDIKGENFEKFEIFIKNIHYCYSFCSIYLCNCNKCYTRKYSDMNVVLSRMRYVRKGLFNSTSQIYPNEFLISEHKEALLTIDSSLNGKLFRKTERYFFISFNDSNHVFQKKR